MAVSIGDVVQYKDADGQTWPGVITAIVSGTTVDLVTWGYGTTFHYQSVAKGTGNNNWNGPLITSGGGAFARRFALRFGAEERTETTTLANDSELLIPVVSGKLCTFLFRVFFYTTAAADFKFDINGPSVTLLRYKQWFLPNGTANPALSNYTLNTAFGATTVVTGAGVEGWVEIDGIFVPSASGTLAFRWAQNTSNAAVTGVHGGSHAIWLEEL